MRVKDKPADFVDLIRADELAAELGVPKPSIYAMAREGVLPKGVVVWLGRRVLFSRAKLREFLESGGRSL